MLLITVGGISIIQMTFQKDIVSFYGQAFFNLLVGELSIPFKSS